MEEDSNNNQQVPYGISRKINSYDNLRKSVLLQNEDSTREDNLKEFKNDDNNEISNDGNNQTQRKSRRRNTSHNYSNNTSIVDFQRRQTLSYKQKITIHSKQNLSDKEKQKDMELKKQYKEYKTNVVSTTKYNIITWLPKSLFMQFFRLANLYFLIISILSFSSFSPKEPLSMSGTLAFVLIVTMVKEAYEDFKRYQSDSQLNNTDTRIFDKSIWKTTHWGSLRVGDIVKIKRDETIPADLLILETSAHSGLCFVDTKNLDGETNLKEKFTHKLIKERFCNNYNKNTKKVNKSNVNNNISINDTSINTDHHMLESDYNFGIYNNFEGKIVCDKPNEYLDSWEGNLFVSSMDDFLVPVNIKNLLLRGSELKNTDCIIGLVVYSGHFTKIMQNAKNPPIKVSHVMKIMNNILLSLFVAHFLVVVIYTGLNLSFSIKNNSFLSSYITNLDETLNYKEPIIKFLTFYVAYSSVIPISLYVAMEVLKLTQNFFVQNDRYMVHEEKTAVCKTADLIEELGQVEFVFSDKTGTLTMNDMIFRFCAINGKVYGKKQEDENTTSFIDGRTNINERAFNNNNNNNYKKKNSFNINGDTDAFTSMITKDSQAELIEKFFRGLSLCHSCISEVNSNKELNYASSSPDELALVKGACEMGFVFTEKTSKYIIFENRYCSKDDDMYEEKWELLAEIPFDSDRKRMSVVVKNKDNEYYIFTKGADNILLPRCSISKDEKDFIDNVLYDFSCEGLRTLVISYKKLDKNFVKNWLSKYSEIQISTAANKEASLNELHDQVETELSVLGITGIEDKLQEGVPQTIEIIINAGIRVWVLTGDKKETALNISKTCRLIEEVGHNQIDITSKVCSTAGQIEEILDIAINKFELNTINEIKQRKLIDRYYLIIDGASLFYVLKDNVLKVKFFKVGLICRSVICCRVSPKQKSEVVSLARNLSNAITLSIGDGSNDVPMIMEANIGVGISGKEGTQAVRSSDYAIGQFKFLQRLLFIHGRDGYKRVSLFICYYFYKNIILVFADLTFVFVSGFSGQVFFPSLLTLMYNCFWTSWPCIFAFGFERDLFKKEELIKDKLNILGPKFLIMLNMYKMGLENKHLNYTIFWKWVFYSVFHGAVTFYMITVGLDSNSNTGNSFNHWTNSTIVFTCVLVIVTMKLFITTSNWNIITLIFAIFSIIFYLFCLYIMSTHNIAYKFQYELAYSFQKLLSSSTFWYCVILVPLVSIIPDLIERFVSEICFPNKAQILMNSEECNLTSEVVRESTDIIKKLSRLHDPREFTKRKTFIRTFHSNKNVRSFNDLDNEFTNSMHNNNEICSDFFLEESCNEKTKTDMDIRIANEFAQNNSHYFDNILNKNYKVTKSNNNNVSSRDSRIGSSLIKDKSFPVIEEEDSFSIDKDKKNSINE